jgi:hypothetical protein
MTCPNEAHVHPLNTIVLFQGHAVIDEQRDLAILCFSERTANRVAELINRHGLVDVPDDAAALTPPQMWGPPTGRQRRALADIHRLPADPTKEDHQ